MKNNLRLIEMIDYLPDVVKNAVHAAAKIAGKKTDELELKRRTHSEKAVVDKLESRQAMKYVSTRHLDRDGEIVVPEGVDLSEFIKYGHVLVNHNYSLLPVGSDKWIKPDGVGIKALTQYADTGKGTLANVVWDLVSQGHLKSSSIGFVPVDTLSEKNAGWDRALNKMQAEWPEFSKSRAQESLKRIITSGVLLEHSDVSVPCNVYADVIAVAKGYGANDLTMKQLGWDMWTEKDGVLVMNKDGLPSDWVSWPGQKPYPNEHAARLTDPDKYVRFARQNDKFGEGVHAIFGILKGGGTELQAIRFDKSKFDVDEAKAWLKEHKHKPILFEKATGEEKSVVAKAEDGRPPKDWWDRCVDAVSERGDVDDPAALCGWIYYHHKKGIGVDFDDKHEITKTVKDFETFNKQAGEGMTTEDIVDNGCNNFGKDGKCDLEGSEHEGEMCPYDNTEQCPAIKKEKGGLGSGHFDKDWDESEHPRVPAGSPEGGQFGEGGGTTLPEKMMEPRLSIQQTSSGSRLAGIYIESQYNHTFSRMSNPVEVARDIRSKNPLPFGWQWDDNEGKGLTASIRVADEQGSLLQPNYKEQLVSLLKKAGEDQMALHFENKGFHSHASENQTGRNFGCYKTKEEAEVRLAQMYKSVEKQAEDERPPKEWFDRCTDAVAGIADDPGALCGWIWYHHKKGMNIGVKDGIVNKSKTDELFNPIEEIVEADLVSLKRICATGEGEMKSNHKLVHHKVADGYPVVWNGVRQAMAILLGARGGIEMSHEDKQESYKHLSKHYREFGEEPPKLLSYTQGQLKEMFPEMYSDESPVEKQFVKVVEPPRVVKVVSASKSSPSMNEMAQQEVANQLAKLMGKL